MSRRPRLRLPPRVEEREETLRTADGVELEARLHRPSGRLRGHVAVAHPHPLHGGTMENKVVTTALRAAASAGYATARWNFRGVGGSTGGFGGGDAEVADLRAGLDAVRDAGGTRAVIGFSFGSMVVCNALRLGLEVDVAVLIGLPLDGWPIGTVRAPSGGLRVVIGAHDVFCPVAMARAWCEESGASLHVLDSTDHMLTGRQAELAARVHEALGGAVDARSGW